MVILPLLFQKNSHFIFSIKSSLFYVYTHTHTYVQQNSINPTRKDRTGAELLNVLDYQTVPTLPEVLKGNFLLLLLHFGCTINQRSIPSGYLLQLLALYNFTATSTKMCICQLLSFHHKKTRLFQLSQAQSRVLL